MELTYKDLLEEAKKIINQTIVDYRPACGLFIDGMDDCEQIPCAIICWLENGNEVIYIHKE